MIRIVDTSITISLWVVISFLYIVYLYVSAPKIFVLIVYVQKPPFKIYVDVPSNLSLHLHSYLVLPAAKALGSLHARADAPEPSLFDIAISTRISCAC